MYLVTHTDLDGVGCEVVARSFFPELTPDKVFHCTHNKVDSIVENLLQESTEKVLVTDISISQQLAEKIGASYTHRTLVLDHHQTAAKYLGDNSWSICDLNRSATLILFDYFKKQHTYPQNLPLFAHFVNEYDLWQMTSSYPVYLNDMLALLGRSKFAQVMLERLANNLPLISDTDMLYLEGYQEKKRLYFEERIKNAKALENRLVIIASKHISEFSEYIRQINDPPNTWQQVKYIDIINFERGSHSLRCYDPEFDVSKIAEKYGGGGHPQAAGYPIQKDNLNLEKL